MFGILKRQKPEPALQEIYLSEEALAPDAPHYSVMMGIVDYTNAVMHSALYKVGEFPEEAYCLYNADYYMGEVLQNGHSRYLMNDRNSGADESSLHYALRAMEMIGCAELQQILQELADWVAANPEEAAQQNGVTHWAEALELLDERFYALNEEDFYHVVRRWAEDNVGVLFLPAEAVRDALTVLPDLNPRFANRQRTNSIAALDAGLTTDTVSYFRACMAGMVRGEQFFEVRAVSGGKPSPFFDHSAPGADYTRGDRQLWRLVANADGDLSGQYAGDSVDMFVRDPSNGELGQIAECDIAVAQRHRELAGRYKPGRFAWSLLKAATPDDPPAFLSFLMPADTPDELPEHYAFYGVTAQSGVQYKMLLDGEEAALFLWPDGELFSKISGSEYRGLLKEDLSRLI
ncbi:DUF4375 domain-containing protein [Thalassobius sp. I31.1]|uniref:DMP19 family protein n=1 Tax=Thalassobius sp. I31.1 TaxID=2109912 RepID=UPI0013008494|nr:DUF4375 domain-containing protein [Thalassobius sp. I31.1]